MVVCRSPTGSRHLCWTTSENRRPFARNLATAAAQPSRLLRSGSGAAHPMCVAPPLASFATMARGLRGMPPGVVSRVCSASGDVRVTVHRFHYAAECEACGNSVGISYRDLRRAFSGRLPGKAWIEGSLICTCEAARCRARREIRSPFAGRISGETRRLGACRRDRLGVLKRITSEPVTPTPARPFRDTVFRSHGVPRGRPYDGRPGGP